MQLSFRIVHTIARFFARMYSLINANDEWIDNERIYNFEDKNSRNLSDQPPLLDHQRYSHQGMYWPENCPNKNLEMRKWNESEESSGEKHDGGRTRRATMKMKRPTTTIKTTPTVSTPASQPASLGLPENFLASSHPERNADESLTSRGAVPITGCEGALPVC